MKKLNLKGKLIPSFCICIAIAIASQLIDANNNIQNAGIEATKAADSINLIIEGLE